MKERPIIYSKITGKPSLRGKRNTRPKNISWKQWNRDGVNKRGRELYAQNPKKYRKMASDYRKNNKDKVYAINRNWLSGYRARLRQEMINAYGGECACCKEKTPQFLQLDHIYNDGAIERKKEGNVSYVFYARLKKRGWPKDRYQLLCANCNFGKQMNKGVCPHET